MAASVQAYPDRQIHLGKIQGHRANIRRREGEPEDIDNPIAEAYTPRDYDHHIDFPPNTHNDVQQPRDPHAYGWTYPGNNDNDQFAGSGTAESTYREETDPYQPHDSFYMAR